MILDKRAGYGFNMTDFAKGRHNLPGGEVSNNCTWGYTLAKL
jgi:hypothetical protein